MSYCRWSSDWFMCDVYVYADSAGGWTTHVAVRTLKHDPPDSITSAPAASTAEWFELVKAYDAWRESLPCDEFVVNYLQPDGSMKPGSYRMPKDSEYRDLSEVGPEAGETFNDPTPSACADRLESLRSKGFRVPQYAIDELRKEAAEAEVSA